jgi:hypothetical protein
MPMKKFFGAGTADGDWGLTFTVFRAAMRANDVI